MNGIKTQKQSLKKTKIMFFQLSKITLSVYLLNKHLSCILSIVCDARRICRYFFIY